MDQSDRVNAWSDVATDGARDLSYPTIDLDRSNSSQRDVVALGEGRTPPRFRGHQVDAVQQTRTATPLEDAALRYRPINRSELPDGWQSNPAESPQLLPLTTRSTTRLQTASSGTSEESPVAGSAHFFDQLTSTSSQRADQLTPPALHQYAHSFDGRRPSTSSTSSFLSQSNDARTNKKDVIRGKLGKILGATSFKTYKDGATPPMNAVDAIDGSSATPSLRSQTGSWTPEQAGVAALASSSSSSLVSLAKTAAGPATLPSTANSGSGSISSVRKPTSRTGSRSRSGTESSTVSQQLSHRILGAKAENTDGTMIISTSMDDGSLNVYQSTGPATPSSLTQSSVNSFASTSFNTEPPELDVKISDLSDLSSMIPAHIGLGPSSRTLSYDSLPAAGGILDKSLPATPDSATPRNASRRDWSSGETVTASMLPGVPAVLPSDEVDTERQQQKLSTDARSSVSSVSRRGTSGPRPFPTDAGTSRRPSAISVSSLEAAKEGFPASSAVQLDTPQGAALRHARAASTQMDLASAVQPETGKMPSRSLSGQLSEQPRKQKATAGTSDLTSKKQEKDPATYVPPGALSFNRKGTAVRDKSTAHSLDMASRMNLERTFGIPCGPANLGTYFDPDSVDDGDEDDSDTVPCEDRGSMLPPNAWAEVEAALARFSSTSPTMQAQAALDKGSLIRNILLPFLALEAETPNQDVAEGRFRSPKARRSLFFDWIAHLLIELQRVQTSADRGAILESIACIIESRNLSVNALANDPADEAKFSSIFGHILLYAIGELNKKGVYQNTLIFSGRLLAVAFFRVSGVANKLLRALPINRFALERVAAEADWASKVPIPFDRYVACFPPSLQDHCFYDARSYLKMLDTQTSAQEKADDERFLVRQPEVEVEMTGNWLRRWQSDDSELFFSFCRSYHHQLAALLTSTRRLRKASKLFFGAPGYAHLATCIHLKCLSLVNRDILSVTTLSSQKSFNPGETANVLSGSTAGKPRHLEAANRRCTAIVVDIVRASNANNDVFLSMLGVHIQTLIQRTSLYDVQGVFCLLDWLDGVLGHMDAAELSIERLVNIDFLITTLGLLLEKADHALALMRAIAFSYSNFAVLISTVEHRRRFCEEILLKPSIFHKLFLSWSFTIRAYFLHLLVFRLARISDFPQPDGDPKGRTAVDIARLFNQRLDEIRRRHEELSPTTPHSGTTDPETGAQEDDRHSTFSRRASSFVSTIKKTPSVVNVEATTKMTKAERVLGIGVPDRSLAGGNGATAGGPESIMGDGNLRPRSRAAKWLRVLGGKNNKKDLYRQALIPPSESPTISNRPRFQQMPRLSELDLSDEEADDEEDALADEAPPANSTLDASLPEQQSAASDPNHGIDPSLHGDHIAADTTFDLQSLQSTGAAAGRHHNAISPRVSRAMSKRASILPRPAYDLVGHGEQEEGDVPPVPSIPAHQMQQASYPESLHIYATLGLREWEAVLAEHDEFFASISNQTGPPAVPRLPVQWPAMWSE